MPALWQSAPATLGVAGRPLLALPALEVPAGCRVALVGANGVGKSTLLRAMAGLHPGLDAAALQGQRLGDLAVAARSRLRAWLPQQATTPAGFAVCDVVQLGCGITAPAGWTTPAPATVRAVDSALHRLGLAGLAGRRAETLSGGERQRMHLARVLVQGAPLWLLDEPLSAQDPRQAGRVLGCLQAHAEAGGAVVAAVHDVATALQSFDLWWIAADGALFVEATREGAMARIVRHWGGALQVRADAAGVWSRGLDPATPGAG